MIGEDRAEHRGHEEEEIGVEPAVIAVVMIIEVTGAIDDHQHAHQAHDQSEKDGEAVRQEGKGEADGGSPGPGVNGRLVCLRRQRRHTAGRDQGKWQRGQRCPLAQSSSQDRHDEGADQGQEYRDQYGHSGWLPRQTREGLHQSGGACKSLRTGTDGWARGRAGRTHRPLVSRGESGKLDRMQRWLIRIRPDGWTAAAVGAGLLWAGAFPPVSAAVLGWLAPVLVLLPGLAVGSGRGFRLGYLAGLVAHLGWLHWLLWNPFPAGAAAGWVALSAYLALFPAVWAWAGVRLAESWGLVRVDGSHGVGRMANAVWAMGSAPAWRRRVWAVTCAALWVGLEMVRARLFTGFPWNPLGASQVGNLPLIQLASVTGVYGLSFLLVWGSLALGNAGMVLVARARRGTGAGGGAAGAGLSRMHPLVAEVALPGLAVVLAMVTGGRQLLEAQPDGAKLRVALVQPSIPQRLIFDPGEVQYRFESLTQLTELALAGRPDVLVWPEAALPNLAAEDHERLLAMVGAAGVWWIFGTDLAEQEAEDPGRIRFYNSALLFDPAGNEAGRYRKQQLVIFGEYVPLMDWVPWLGRLTPIEGSFSRGPGPVTFRLNPPEAATSVLICYEDVFPHLARRHVTAEVDFLLNLTNDAWFGESAAHWQHLANATFRAIENGVPLVRCANNGISGWIDARGRWHDLDFGPGTGVYEAGFKIVEVPLARPRPGPTIYRRHGDWFGWVCVAVWMSLLRVAWPGCCPLANRTRQASASGSGQGDRHRA